MIVDRLKRLLFSSFCMSYLLPLVEYLMLDFFYSGGWVFFFAEKFYIYTFNLFFRQRSKCCTPRDRKHWENPEVYGINRRESHVPLRSFSSPEIAREYWSKGGGASNRDMLRNVFLLTGPAGKPEGSAGETVFVTTNHYIISAYPETSVYIVYYSLAVFSPP